ncbi:MAG TPA: peptide chain release factor 2 [Candidatus Azoamicus sp. OHIO2]
MIKYINILDNLLILKKKFEKLMMYLRPHIYYKRLNQLTIILKQVNNFDKYFKIDHLFTEEASLIKCLDKINSLNQNIKDFEELFQLSTNDNDSIMLLELQETFQKLILDVNKLEEDTLFTSQADNCNAFLEIQSGTGGLDAQDWVEILFKMYTTWFEKKNFIYIIKDLVNGDSGGIKFISIQINGKNAYGWLKHELGIHRLVRKSPFDTNNKRHTSFASVFVYPENLEKCSTVLNETNIKIDTFRSSGAGGQHVNKTDSAIRITHIPTKIVVQCQSDRSQHKNKIQALTQLKMKIEALQNLTTIHAKDKKNKLAITWGNQIRSYVFDKSYIKDLRTHQEITDIQFILNGNLDIFILELLKL